jgi:hypothetical protein
MSKAFEQRTGRHQSNYLINSAKRAQMTPLLAQSQSLPLPQQQTSGNQAVQKFAQSFPLVLLGPRACPFGGLCHTCTTRLQTELKIGRPGDKYEQEADRVAEQVMAMPHYMARMNTVDYPQPSPPTIHRAHRSCEERLQQQPMGEENNKEGLEITEEELRRIEDRMDEELERIEEEELRRLKREEEFIQPKQADWRTPLLDSSLRNKIRSLRGGGQPLPQSIRGFFEPRFGYDFSQVRLHTDSMAAECAHQINARAFTIGSNVVFGQGQYAPATTAGKRLLAHELTHIVQQGCGTEERIQLDPCNQGSRATTYTPTAQGVTVHLGSHDFGNTGKHAASCSFGACRAGGDWRFYIDTLTVRIASAVQPVNYRTNVNAATDPAVTSSTYATIINDLRPNRRARASTICGGNTFTDTIPTYSRRNTYWKRQLVVDHEAYHRQDWDRIYRPELILAEQQVWNHSIPVSTASTSRGAIQQANRTLRSYIGSAYQRACQQYAPQQETRAYGAGAPQYQQLVDDIVARARHEGW